MVVGSGAPSRRAYFAGEQHALVSRTLSACIAFSSFNQPSVCRRICEEIQEPETGVIPESLKEPFHVEGLLRCHIFMYTP